MTFLLLLACGDDPVPAPEVASPAPAAPAAPKHAALFDPLPAHLHDGAVPSDALIDLGRMLYHEPRLSKGGDLSCSSCHALDAWGVDGEVTSPGHQGARGDRNSPTSYNAALHVAQFWDGREPDVEAQAKGPILNPIEMAMPDAATVEAVLRGIPGYRSAFAAAFPGQPEPVTYDNLATAIGAFERGLVTPSPFDAYLAGSGSLSDAQARGLDLFVSTGCAGCHNGVGVGGASYWKLGQVHPYDDDDPGRFAVTGVEADRQVFKAPSLRNVEKTGPWFHDGSVATLEDAVGKMAWHQLGQELTPEQTADVVAFLGSLTGELPLDYVAAPVLPE